ncbi:hypothetical protein WJX73_006740 [Symbiochloris irregularis]|uniref:Expansin-like EG45 domain-containing protein n=1 Tax=Symbiochloris irregularis TaxID=706552 RepID=A0AAW1PJN4_9CHLO
METARQKHASILDYFAHINPAAGGRFIRVRSAQDCVQELRNKPAASEHNVAPHCDVQSIIVTTDRGSAVAATKMKGQLVLLAFALMCMASATARSLHAAAPGNSTCTVMFYDDDSDDDDDSGSKGYSVSIGTTGCAGCQKVDSHFFNYHSFEANGGCGKTITVYDSKDCSSNNDDDDDQSKPLSTTSGRTDIDDGRDLRSFLLCN